MLFRSIWIKTPVNYCFYNREKDEFDNRIDDKLSTLGIRDSVKQIYVDADHNLWCATIDTIYCYRFSEERLYSIEMPGKTELLDLSCRNYNAYLLFSDGNIGTIDWLHNQISIETDALIIPDLNHHIYLDTENCLWLYITHSSTLMCYSTSDKKWINYAGQDEISKKHIVITRVTDDGKGNIWFGTDNLGIFIRYKDESRLTHITRNAQQKFSLPTNHITCFYKDARDIMWIGMSKQGVAYS